MRFEFATVGRIVFGWGVADELGEIAASLGRRALVVVGSRTLDQAGAVDRLASRLTARQVDVVVFRTRGEPDVELVDAGARQAVEAGRDLVVGLGGGSALDAAKAIAGLAANGGSALDYMEVVGQGRTLTRPALPVIAVPTTAGTGAEVTRNAVIAAKDRAFKASIRSAYLLPRVALVDPALTASLSPEVTASTGLDALTQLVEAFVSRRASPVTEALAREGIRRASRSLPRAYGHGDDTAAREDMCLASLLSGIALANAGLGAVHGFASPLGGMFPVPHGVACAALLPHVMAANVRALRAREPDGPTLAKYAEVGEVLVGRRLGSEAETIDAGVQVLAEMCRQMGIPPLREFGIRREDVPGIVVQAEGASSTRGNPITLTCEELTEALLAAVG